jgi:hypothetical protein
MSNFGFKVRSIFQISGVLIVCVLAAVETSSAVGTTLVYELVGQCGSLVPLDVPAAAGPQADGTLGTQNCTGTGIGYLTVQNYVPGQPLSYANFVSFTYTSNINPIPSGITPSTPNFSSSSILTGTMPVSLTTAAAPVAVTLGWDSSDYVLVTSSAPNGIWCVSGSGGCSVIPGDFGFGSTWVVNNPTVPALSTAALCALGLLLAGTGALLVRRARRTARA